MARSDLVALTDDGLVQLANAGLVKRGLRDIADGKGPILDERADGTIEARFGDGTITRLASGKAPEDAACSCPSSGMCRHRVALVLAYRQAHREAGETPLLQEWDPGEFEIGPLLDALGREARSELARLRRSELTVRLSRSAPPTASMPMATVRFLAPHDAFYARCDCATGKACAHIVLAVEAFKASGGANDVTLGAASDLAPATGLIEAGDAVLSRLLQEGATAGIAALGPLIDRARKAFEIQGATWLVLALEALGEQIIAYEQRSALYDEREVLDLAVEIHARPRATLRSACGFGEAMETAMGKTRLVSLGARIRARGRAMEVRIALFDTDTGATLLMEKLFAEPESGARLSNQAVLSRQIAPGLSVKGLARGQLLTSAAQRRADGTLRLGSGAGGRSTLMSRAALAEPASPLLVQHIDPLRAALADRPPSFLSPRNRLQPFHVFNIDQVIGQAFEPGSQIWRAAVSLAGDGGRLNLQRRYDAGAPAAIDILGAAFDGQYGEVRQIAGQVWQEDGDIVCDPWSLTADGFIVPDCDQDLQGAEIGTVPQNEALHGPAAAYAFLAGALHAGMRRRDDQLIRRGHRVADELAAAGYARSAARMKAWLLQEDVASFGMLAIWLRAQLEL